MGTIEIEVTSTTELIDQVLQLGAAGEEGPRKLWHRGHRSDAYSLVPSLLRSLDSVDEIFSLERRLITRFRQRSLPYWPAGYPQSDWEHLFAMQHYGIPTRMLDWSENLLVALYFAASSGSSSQQDEDVPVIWSLDPIRWNQLAPQFKDFDNIAILTTDSDELIPYAARLESSDLLRRYKIPLAIYGTHNSARIVAQRGAFTVAGKSLDGLDTFAPDGEDVLWKIRLNYARETMLRDLEVLGFAESMIFPDLVGLSREIAASEGLK